MAHRRPGGVNIIPILIGAVERPTAPVCSLNFQSRIFSSLPYRLYVCRRESTFGEGRDGREKNCLYGSPVKVREKLGITMVIKDWRVCATSSLLSYFFGTPVWALYLFGDWFEKKKKTCLRSIHFLSTQLLKLEFFFKLHTDF